MRYSTDDSCYSFSKFTLAAITLALRLSATTAAFIAECAFQAIAPSLTVLGAFYSSFVVTTTRQIQRV